MWLLLLSCLFQLSFLSSYERPPLYVTVTGVPQATGDVLLGVWTTEGEFLSDQARVAGIILPARAGEVRFELTDLPPGRYAISVLHDKDRNGKMTKSMLGWPVEAYGFSNNARNTFSAPDFADCAFELRERTELVIGIK